MRRTSVKEQSDVRSHFKRKFNNKSPRSLGPHTKAGIFGSQASIDSQDTIKQFFAKDNCAQVQKTASMVEKEKKRVETLAKVRENALNIAMDTRAKQLLKDKRDQQNEKKYKELLRHQDEELRARMEDEDIKRDQAKVNVRIASRHVEERSYKAHSVHI